MFFFSAQKIGQRASDFRQVFLDRNNESKEKVYLYER